ncbi:hypothetical protein [Streptomyces rochei]|uniref:hypothetical protein n=1 Tax=Streptomyces rochei TaxID=1928 RepID=UPI0036CFE21F
MTDAMHLCRHCDQPITDPKDAVLITQEAGNSGPGRNVWAHRQHANRTEPHPVAVRAHRRWAADGTFDRMLRAAQAKADAAGDVEWLVSVDSTVVRAHQHAAGARKGSCATRPSAGPGAV